MNLFTSAYFGYKNVVDRLDWPLVSRAEFHIVSIRCLLHEVNDNGSYVTQGIYYLVIVIFRFY